MRAADWGLRALGCRRGCLRLAECAAPSFCAATSFFRRRGGADAATRSDAGSLGHALRAWRIPLICSFARDGEADPWGFEQCRLDRCPLTPALRPALGRPDRCRHGLRWPFRNRPAWPPSRCRHTLYMYVATTMTARAGFRHLWRAAHGRAALQRIRQLRPGHQARGRAVWLRQGGRSERCLKAAKATVSHFIDIIGRIDNGLRKHEASGTS